MRPQQIIDTCGGVMEDVADDDRATPALLRLDHGAVGGEGELHPVPRAPKGPTVAGFAWLMRAVSGSVPTWPHQASSACRAVRVSSPLIQILSTELASRFPPAFRPARCRRPPACRPLPRGSAISRNGHEGGPHGSLTRTPPDEWGQYAAGPAHHTPLERRDVRRCLLSKPTMTRAFRAESTQPRLRSFPSCRGLRSLLRGPSTLAGQALPKAGMTPEGIW